MHDADRFRFANRLEGWIEVDDGGIAGYRLNFPRASCDLDLDRARAAGIRAEQSRVAPAFEQPGGGTQYQFIRPGCDEPLSQRELEALGVIGRRTP